jgi:hypothetical protein
MPDEVVPMKSLILFIEHQLPPAFFHDYLVVLKHYHASSSSFSIQNTACNPSGADSLQ